MVRQANKFYDGHMEVHFSFSVNDDVAICGCDIFGDSKIGYKGIGVVNKAVNCPDCLRLVNEVKNFKLRKSEIW
jgi:hypothetical protein